MSTICSSLFPRTCLILEWHSKVKLVLYLISLAIHKVLLILYHGWEMGDWCTVAYTVYLVALTLFDGHVQSGYIVSVHLIMDSKGYF